MLAIGEHKSSRISTCAAVSPLRRHANWPRSL